MLATTLDIIRSGLKADPTVTPSDRTQLLTLLRTEKPSIPKPTESRLLDRTEVAGRLHVSVRTIDRLSREGFLHRITFPGRKRAAGFREQEVISIIEGRQS